MGDLRVVAFTSSPRVDGNSRLLAEAVLEGARGAGHTTELVHLRSMVDGLLRDCRTCRAADGLCSTTMGWGARRRGGRRRQLADARGTDYRVETDRPNRVWGDPVDA